MSFCTQFRPAALITLLALCAGTTRAADQDAGPFSGQQVRSTIVEGTPPMPPLPSRAVRVLGNGDINLNFPGVDIQAVAKAVLGDTLGVSYTIDPTLHTAVTLRTPHPVRRQDVIAVFEQALTNAELVLVNRGGAYAITTVAAAKAEAPVVGPQDMGFGNQTVVLKYVNAEEMQKLLEPLVPGAISVSDPTHNILLISGTQTQRQALTDLVAQFDVDWLKGMSFGLFVPQRTDARLIAPELEKLLNAPGAQSAGLVRLIAMDRLNGILAITSQARYLDDVRRFVEILDREGESSERRVFVYRVQNGRASDLAKVLGSAFGAGGGGSSGGGLGEPEPPGLSDHTSPSASTLPQQGLGGGVPGGLMGGAANAFQARQAGVAAASGGSSGAGGSSMGLGANGTTITADETNNAIVVFSTPRDYALISDALAKLDVPPLQVMIDASITEVSLNHTLQYGLQWAFQTGRLGGTLSQGTATANPTTGAISLPGPVQNFPGLSFLYQGQGWSATLNALAKVTDVNVLSAPKLVVLNNHTATIQVGDQVPISTGSAVSTITSTAPIVNSIEYRDTGIILKVTPRVNSGGLVLLDIAQEVSDVSNTTTSTISSPTIQQRKIATSVAVQDGETVALGGLMKNTVNKGRSSIPGFGNIPLLGHLFGDTTGELHRTELLVLLTPHVIRTPVDARAVTEELRQKIHLGAPPSPPPKRHAP